MLSVYLFRAEGEQKLLLLTGGKNASYRGDVENTVCGRVELDVFALWSFPGELRVQVGLHGLPVEGQLQVASDPERERESHLVCNDP